MASACVNNSIGMSPDTFPVNFPSYGWLSPRISFSREEEVSNQRPAKNPAPENSDPDVFGSDFADFEFRLEDPVAMLPADELFSDGKLVPLHLSAIRNSLTSAPAANDVRSTDIVDLKKEIFVTDPYSFSPKAPRCSSRWRELLGLKKLYVKSEDLKTTSSMSSDNNNNNNNNNRNAAVKTGLKHFLHRTTKSSLNSSIDSSSINCPLLRDTDNDSVSISARLSLSSSSSSGGHEHDDLPRLSLDLDKPNSVARNPRLAASKLSRVRQVKRRTAMSSETNQTPGVRTSRTPESTVPPMRGGVSVDSPRMNSSGKIVFHSLERSSSSPSTFNGGPRYKHRGMERSYSANIRVTPVLNVPVCSIRGSSKSSGVFGLPLFGSQQKNGGGSVGGNRINLKNRN